MSQFLSWNTPGSASNLILAPSRRRIGATPTCPRCGFGIGPDDVSDFGHDDYDPRFEGPEHRACNRAAAISRRPRASGQGLAIREE